MIRPQIMVLDAFDNPEHELVFGDRFDTCYYVIASGFFYVPNFPPLGGLRFPADHFAVVFSLPLWLRRAVA